MTFDFPEVPNGIEYRYYIQQSGGAREEIVQGGKETQKYTESVSVEAYVVNLTTGVIGRHVYRDYIITDADDLGELYINWPYNQDKISKHLLGKDEYAKGILFGGTYGNKKILYQVKYTPNGGSETEYSPEYIYDDKLPVIPTSQMENITIKAWIDGDKENVIEHKIEFIDLGIPDGEFKPAKQLSRAEFAALISRFVGTKETNTQNPFADLEESHWAYNEIIALVKSGLVEGYEDGTFRPDNNITRAEVMTVINKLLGRKPLEDYVKSLKFNPYNDLCEDKWYYVTVLEATITHNYWLDNAEYEYKWEDWK